jgi:hypothetical protein
MPGVKRVKQRQRLTERDFERLRVLIEELEECARQDEMKGGTGEASDIKLIEAYYMLAQAKLEQHILQMQRAAT